MDKCLIGSRIKSLRKERGYKTQEELAAALRNNYNLKTDRAMVGKWEIGYQAPEMYTIKCLADLLGTTMDYLSGDEANQPTTVSSDGLNPEHMELLKFLSKADLDIVLSVARQMKQRENQSEK